MPKTFPDIIRLADGATGSFASMDTQQIRGTATQIDDLTSASLATIGSGLSGSFGKRSLGHIVVISGSATKAVKYYAFIQTSSGDTNLSGSEWTTLTNWGEIQVGSSGDTVDLHFSASEGTGFSFANNATASFESGSGGGLTVTAGATNKVTFTLVNVISSSVQIATEISGAIDAATGSVLLNNGLLSSSFQIEGDISGAIDAATSSILNDYGLLSSSIQIGTEISGAINAATGALSASIVGTTDEIEVTSTGPGNVTIGLPDNVKISGNLTAVGDVIAQRYIVSSSVSHITQSFSSGSTIFGDTINDTHQFTGSLLLTGSLVADLSTDATNERTPLVIDGNGNVTIANADFATTGDVTITAASVSGAIDAATGSVLLDNGLLSSSAQIADEISGSLGFSIQGDGGAIQPIANGDTIDIAGGTNVNTQGSATDTITVNLDDNIFLTGQGLFLSGGLHDWGKNDDADATSGFRLVGDRAYTHVTPQFTRARHALVGSLIRSTPTMNLASFPLNYLVYSKAGVTINGGINDTDPDVTTPVDPKIAGGGNNIGVPVVQIAGDLEIRPTQSMDGGGITPGIRIAAGDSSGSIDPAIYFYNRDNTSNDSSSFFYSSASAEIRFDTASNSVKFLAGSTTENLAEVLHISKSGNNPRIGIGTTDPKTVFDFKDIEDNTTGAELLIRSARTSTTGALSGDEGGSINFVIDSGSFTDLKTSGSIAKIKTKVTDVGAGGVAGKLAFELSKTAGGETVDAFEYGFSIGDQSLFAAVQTASLIIKDFNEAGESILQMRDFSDNVRFEVNDGDVEISGSLGVTGSANFNGGATVTSLTAASITASGDISASGDLKASKTVIDGVVALDTGDNSTTGNVFGNSTTTKVTIGKAGTTTSTVIEGNITASGDISSSGTVIAATLDATAVSDTLAAAIVAEIDNDEIPIAKLAEDAVTVTAGTGLSGGGSVTLGDSITINSDGLLSSSAQISTDISGSFTAASASIAADIVTNAGNIGTTTNALTVDNATLQLNSGTTFNGSAARTISIKDGGVDSDALAANISVTQLTASIVSSSGDVMADRYFLQGTRILSDSGGEIQINETTLPININGPSINLAAPVTASGNISSSSDITANSFIADKNSNDGYYLKGSGKPILSQNGAGGAILLGTFHTSLDHSGINLHTTGSANAGLFLDGLGNATASGDISASGTVTANSFTGNGLSIDGSQNSHIEVGTYNVGFDTAGASTLFITGSGLIVSGAMADANHHNMVKIGNVELIDLNSAVSTNEFLIHNVNSLKITSGSDGGDIAGTSGRLFEHNGTDFTIYKDNSSVINAAANGTVTFNGTNISFVATSATFMKATNDTPGANGHLIFTEGNPNTTPSELRSINFDSAFPFLGGAVTASAVSSSGTITMLTASIGGGTFTSASLASAIAGGSGGGTTTNALTVDNATLQLNSGTTFDGSAAKTISIKDGGVDSDALADDITIAGTLTVDADIQHSGDTDTKIAFSTDALSIKAGNVSVFESSATGSVLPNVHQNIFDTGSLALNANSAFGDIVKFGNSSTVAGGLYFLKHDGTWALAQANAAGTSTSSLAVAVGTNSTTDGMCIRGFINPFTDPGAGIGSPVYISDTNPGRILATAPNSTGDVVRIVGHQYGTDLIYFNPSNDFIVHA